MSKVNDTTWRDMITALRTLPKPVVPTPRGSAAKLNKPGDLTDVRPSFRDNKYILASLKQSKSSPMGATSNVTPNSRMPSGMFTDLFNQNLSVNQKYDRYLANIDTDDLEEATPQGAAAKKDFSASKKDVSDSSASLRAKHGRDVNSGGKSVRPNSGKKSHKDVTSDRLRDSLIGEESYEDLQSASLEFRHRMSPGSRPNQAKVSFKEELKVKFLTDEGNVKSKPRHLESPEHDCMNSSASTRSADKNVHFRKERTELGKAPSSR